MPVYNPSERTSMSSQGRNDDNMGMDANVGQRDFHRSEGDSLARRERDDQGRLPYDTRKTDRHVFGILSIGQRGAPSVESYRKYEEAAKNKKHPDAGLSTVSKVLGMSNRDLENKQGSMVGLSDEEHFKGSDTVELNVEQMRPRVTANRNPQENSAADSNHIRKSYLSWLGL